MKLNTAPTHEVAGNTTGEVIQVGIADMRLIIDRLTDMYSDREAACLREYICNANDAHIEAGTKCPIEVKTPTPLMPFLSIQDFGIGLNVDEIRTIYSQYGASTKRLSNDQTGAFGLGCKSALAYCDQFTVSSVKDGVRIQVLVSRDPKLGITMKIVDTSDTDEPNGTTVLIPAKAHNYFEQKARKMLQYWPKGSVKLNGQDVEYMPNAKWVTDSICINENTGYGESSYIVMGGVPYPVSIDVGIGYGKSITAFVPIGSVTPMPARESLGDDDDTLATIAKVKQDFRDGLQEAIRKDIADADSPAAAARLKREWQQQVGNANMPAGARYKGQDVPDSYQFEHLGIVAPRYGRKMNAHTTYRQDQFLALPSVCNAVWVTGFDHASFTATTKKKLEKWCEEQGMNYPPNYILWAHPGKPDTTWLEGVTFVDWPTIKAVKLPKKARNLGNGRIPGSYDIFEDGDLNEDTPADDIDTSNDVFWMIGKWYNGQQIASWLSESYPGSTLVMMREGRQDKFCRNFPNAKNAADALKEGFKKWLAGIDKRDAQALATRTSADSRLMQIDLSKVDDPSIAAARTIMDRPTGDLEAEIRFWRGLGHYYSPDTPGASGDPLAKYTLLPESYYFGRYLKRNADHLYRYMNAEYAYLKEQS